jgi:Zn finger protein HypA/HybF involved in hydrogenase expression
MSKTTPISKNKEAEVFEAICIRCEERFIAVVDWGTKLMDMICPQCGGEGTIIKTGECADRLDYDQMPQDEGL